VNIEAAYHFEIARERGANLGHLDGDGRIVSDVEEIGGAKVTVTLICFGASGNSVGLRVEVKSAAMEVDGGLEVVPVAVAACRDADGLDA
jgi:hypothetical protein